MEPTTLITNALATGELELKEGRLSEAGRGAYAALRALIRARFRGNEKATKALEYFEDEPDTYEKPLLRAIQETNAHQDPEVLKLASKILASGGLVSTTSGTYILQVPQSKGFQVGEKMSQINSFGALNPQ